MTGLRVLRVAPFGAVALSALVEVASSASSGIAVRALAGRTGETLALRKRLADPLAVLIPTRFGLLLSAGLAGLAAREAGAS